jgi:uncharacterized membrane protein (UPF0127 family)
MVTRFGQIALVLAMGLVWVCGCSSGEVAGGNGRISDAQRRYPLDSLPTASVRVRSADLRVWVVQESDPNRPGVVQEGLMFVPPEELPDNQGMLFVFDEERIRGFWMRNTITPLDIAFARANGTIVKTQQMPPLTLETFSSVEPAMFALEMKQGSFAKIGLREGDRLEIPAVALEPR